MAILDRENYFERLNNFIGDRNDDESIKFMEDMSDTFEDLTNRANGDGVDWKNKFQENDKMWKERYKSRFFSGNTGNPDVGYPDDTETEEKGDITIDDLFEQK